MITRKRILMFAFFAICGYFAGKDSVYLSFLDQLNTRPKGLKSRQESNTNDGGEETEDYDEYQGIQEVSNGASSESQNTTDIFGTCKLTIVRDPLYKRSGLLVRYTDPIACCNRSYWPGALLHNGRVSLNPGRTKEFSYCRGRCYKYLNPLKAIPDKWVNITKKKMAVDCDFFKTECFDKEGNDKDQWLHMQIVENDQSTVKQEPKKKDRMQPDVLLIVLDSVGSAQARRSLPRTLAYLETKMKGRHYWNLNKVGINSNPNAYALLLGWRIYGPKRSPMGGTNIGPEHPEYARIYLDNTTAIFKQYERQGYKTLYSDDYTFGTPFTYPNGNGFQYQETNHIFSPLVSTTRWDIKLAKYMKADHCYERYLWQLKYTEMFMNSYENKPKMVVHWNAGLAHDHPHLLYHADQHFFKFFRENRKRLDNAFIIIVGDHGPRFGGLVSTEIGPRESKNPLLHITLPSFLRRNQELKKIMEENSVRLVTQYDVYATMVDILKHLPDSDFTDFSQKEVIGGGNENNGTSLLRPFADKYAKRSCRNIPVDSTHCLCEYEMERIGDKKILTKVGPIITKEINKLLKENNISSRCARLEFEKVKRVQVFVPAEVTKLYHATVYLKPGMGLFKTVLRLNDNGEFTCEGDIIRLNEYKRQADCIAEEFPTLRPYCYCKGYVEKKRITKIRIDEKLSGEDEGEGEKEDKKNKEDGEEEEEEKETKDEKDEEDNE